jgi:hypothetical protein
MIPSRFAAGARAVPALAALLLALAGCAETGTYPITGEPCGPDDPVGDVRAGECIPRD